MQRTRARIEGNRNQWLEVTVKATDNTGASLAELAWFYDQEQFSARNRPAGKYGRAESAVDKLLATRP